MKILIQFLPSNHTEQRQPTVVNLEPKMDRSSYPKKFCKKSVLKNFAKFKGKHLCRSLFLNKVADL